MQADRLSPMIPRLFFHIFSSVIPLCFVLCVLVPDNIRRERPLKLYVRAKRVAANGLEQRGLLVDAKLS
jgi:hypothetical protein